MAAPSIVDPRTAYPLGIESLTPATNLSVAVQRIGPDFTVVPLEQSAYVKPSSILYTMDGKQRRWDMVSSHPSVGVVLYHRTRHAFLVVRQFRPAVYALAMREAAAAQQPQPPLLAGFTYELVAGIIDKDLPLTEIAREEIIEEAGYDVPASGISLITTALSSTGTSGSPHHMYFAEVDESMRVGPGGGLPNHGECIEVLSVPFDAAEAFVLDSSLPKSPGIQFGLVWAQAALLRGSIGSLKRGGSNGTETGTLVLNSVVSA